MFEYTIADVTFIHNVLYCTGEGRRLWQYEHKKRVVYNNGLLYLALQKTVNLKSTKVKQWFTTVKIDIVNEYPVTIKYNPDEQNRSSF